jgi:hypothetical protein
MILSFNENILINGGLNQQHTLRMLKMRSPQTLRNNAMQKYKLQAAAKIGLAWIFTSTQACIAQQNFSGFCHISSPYEDLYFCREESGCHGNGSPTEKANWYTCGTGAYCSQAEYGNGITCVSNATGASVKTFRNTQR